MKLLEFTFHPWQLYMLLIKRFIKFSENRIQDFLKNISLVFSHSILYVMNCLTLKIILVVTAKTVVLCNNDLINKESIVFSITNYGRLPSEVLLAVSKNIVGDCLHACMQHLACLTINYHRRSGRCELLADILYKKELIEDIEWVSYGHYESDLVRYVYNYFILQLNIL